MSTANFNTAISFDGERLCVVVADVAGRRVTVRQTLIAQRPEDVDRQNALAVAQWAQAEMARAGMKGSASGGVVIAATRGEVTIKRLTLPPGIAPAERPDAVRLAMQRQMTFSSEGAAIDFVEIPHGAGGAEGTDVLAAAMSDSRLAFYRAFAKAAGFKLGRVGVASVGAAALGWEGAAGAVESGDGATLLVVVSLRGVGPGGGAAGGSGAASCEFIVVRNGQLDYSRAADLIDTAGPESPSDPAVPAAAPQADAMATAVLAEARRTWMSYRMAPDSADVRRIVVLGSAKSDAFAADLAQRLSESLEMPASAVGLPETVELAAAQRGQGAELVGVIGTLAEQSGPTLDLSSPKQPPDTGAAKRRLTLLGALAAVIVAGTGYTFATRDLDAHREELKEVTDAFKTRIKPEHDRYLRQKLRMEHFDRWLATRSDWLGHLSVLSEQMPDPSQAILDSVSGETVAAGTAVEYLWPKGATRSLSSGAWSTSLAATIDIAGSTKQRGVADGIRDKFEKDPRYNINTKGADIPNRFEYRITTTSAKPSKVGKPAESAKPVEPAAPGAANPAAAPVSKEAR